MMERIKAIGDFLLIMGVGYFAGMLWTLPTMALTDLSVPYTFGDSDTIYASRFNANYDTIEVRFNQLNDSLDLRFIRYSSVTGGDSTLSRLQVDTIRSNPDIDSIMGRPWIDSISTSYIAAPTIKTLDTLRGNPDVDSIKGYPWIDSVNTSMVNAIRIYTDSIKGLTFMDSVTGLDYVRGNPSIDSANFTKYLRVTGKMAVDTITDLDYLRGNPNIDSINIGTITSSPTIAGSVSINSATANPSLNIIGSGTTDADQGSILFSSGGNTAETRIGIVNNESDNVLDINVRSASTDSWINAIKITRATGAVSLDGNLNTDGTLSVGGTASISGNASFFGQYITVSDTDHFNTGIQLDSRNAGHTKWQILSGGTGTTYGSPGSILFRDSDRSSTRMSIDTSGNVAIVGSVSSATVNTGNGDNELYPMDQGVLSTDTVVFDSVTVTNGISASKLVSSTVNTGNGDNELYAMDQNVQTTDDVTFNKITVTDSVYANNAKFNQIDLFSATSTNAIRNDSVVSCDNSITWLYNAGDADYDTISNISTTYNGGIGRGRMLMVGFAGKSGADSCLIVESGNIRISDATETVMQEGDIITFMLLYYPPEATNYWFEISRSNAMR